MTEFNAIGDIDFGQAVVSELDAHSRKIHIRWQKGGSRSVTLVEGLDDDLDQKRIAKAMKKAFSCSVSIHKDDNGDDIIKLQGDQRENVKTWLIQNEVLTEAEVKSRIVMHG